MTLAWILGSTGLLGSALNRTLRSTGRELFAPSGRLPWGNTGAMEDALRAGVKAFGDSVEPNGSWEIYWAAGAGTMGSRAEDLTGETLALRGLLRCVAADQRLMQADGAVALASSAGAIYAGAGSAVITEKTDVAPTTPYAAEKLRQEDLLRTFAIEQSRSRVLLARISTLYGAGQAAGKKQGLLSHMARSVLRNRPIQIYVPFDTVRDYIEASDAASKIVHAMQTQPMGMRCQLRIIASECPVSIAEIIAIFKRIARKNPRIVTSASRLSNLYSRRVQFKSILPVPTPNRPPRQIAVGIAQLLMAERMAYTACQMGPSIRAPQGSLTAKNSNEPQKVAP